MQSLVSAVRRAVIYEVRSTRAHMVLIPARDDWDPACGASASSEDFDTDRWFGGRQVLESVHTFPGTDCRLVNSFDIITLCPDAAHVTHTANSSIRRLFDTEWTGNLLVVKRGRYDYSRAINITRSEVSLINAMVERYISRLRVIYSVCSLEPQVATTTYSGRVGRRYMLTPCMLSLAQIYVVPSVSVLDSLSF